MDFYFTENMLGACLLHSFIDVYRLDQHAHTIQIELEGLGAKSYQRLWESIQKSRNTTFERYVVAMDIPLVGSTAAKELCRHFSGSLMQFEIAVDNAFDFTTLSGIGETLHRNIHTWFKDEENRNTWEELQKM